MLLLLLAGATQAAYAQETNRAGLVVIDGAGESHTFCVDFAEEMISGYDLLQRAGLELIVEASAMGATICAIDGEGCAYPTESCFCQCQGSPCVYWSYWTLDAGAWRYETLGAANTRIHNGDVQGWRWGAGTVTEAHKPPLQTWAAICTGAESPASSKDEPPPTAAVTAVVAVTVATTSSMTAKEMAVSAPGNATPSDTRGASAANGLDAGALLAWLGVLAVPLALGGWLMWRRRGQP